MVRPRAYPFANAHLLKFAYSSQTVETVIPLAPYQRNILLVGEVQRDHIPFHTQYSRSRESPWMRW